MLKLVKIKQSYTDYLRKYDNRVSFNCDYDYERVYIGVLFKIKNDLLYFAPLTSSAKGMKLKYHPQRESITFYPLRHCRIGGINFNNMIPVIEGVYKVIKINEVKNIKFKHLYINQLREINKNNKLLLKKARTIYNLKIQKRLYKSFDDVTCDFKLLEKMAKLYETK